VSVQRIVLVGFSGTGKSTVAALVARELGWSAIDVDREIEASEGKRIPQIFAEDGEERFREIERARLLDALRQEQVVVATGGGAVIPDVVWTTEVLKSPGTVTIALDAEVETSIRRLESQVQAADETIERPMLAGNDPLGRARRLKAARQSAYDRADLTLIVDDIPPDEVAREVVSVASPSDADDVELSAAGGTSRIVVAPGSAARIGKLTLQRWPSARQAWLITDDCVGPIHAERVTASLAGAGLMVRTLTVPAGEASKSWDRAGSLVSEMLSGGIQRNDVVVALGGGVVGDLAGFAAAVVLRGVGLVQVPTSLLAMVDSSVGGKTAVNHSAGKNLIGVFYQPPLVVIDPEMLHSLPPRELTQSWAEIVKHALIQPSTPGGQRADLARFLNRNRLAVGDLSGPAMTYLIRRNVQLKASVVEADEREASLRAILNYGHTIGHAIEAAEYRYLHGEAIAVGMRAANRIARLSDMIDDEREWTMNRLIENYGLPAAAEFDVETVREKMRSDKKQVAGTQKWVLPTGSAGVQITTAIPDEVISEAIESIAV
jgi:shikimate kinase/3-dehydroquinate synthase